MITLEELQERLKIIDDNLTRGEELKAQGYDCDTMMGITRLLRVNVMMQIKELTDDNAGITV